MKSTAISPPMLAPSLSINSVLSNEGSSALLRMKVKVYPPQVGVSMHFFFDSSQLMGLHRRCKLSM